MKEIDAALTNLETPTIAQTLGDLSLAQFWLQKVETVARLPQLSVDARTLQIYEIVLEDFFNYENRVDAALGAHNKPRYSTHIQDGSVILDPNTDSRETNIPFVLAEYSE